MTEKEWTRVLIDAIDNLNYHGKNPEAIYMDSTRYFDYINNMSQERLDHNDDGLVFYGVPIIRVYRVDYFRVI